jgi:DNA invertase Pin-like site-specific DNA recombinase
MNNPKQKRYSRELTEDQAQEFWKSLLSEGKSISWYAKKYNTSNSAIDRAYNKMREKNSRK